MMRWLILGALLGLLLLYPSLLAAVLTIAVALLSKPLVVAFAAGLAARPYLPRIRRWAR
ncbi:hypothetical protein [Streptomyces sp. HUAS TT20]|uniref:hypothetical protein n=1 Tax=Streptomyces sp. HUAS TT20 TaxID=3447509 RepID=UPI0021D95C5E|nr:hypothetical protein [Streptomyces sp. HUAS 15-9]UXY32919.1 hypothetical protein N8I87_19675 [Streptomyces sp. HUAS 15-9]